jgi:Protein of unknown function (DUF2934)
MAPPKKTKAAPVATPAAAPATPTAAPQRSEVKGSGTAKAAAPKPEVTWQAIERRAFEIYAGRGYAAGDQNADWYEAERQLRAGL